MKNLLSRFVDSNERELRHLRPVVDEVNGLEAEFQALSDEAIRERMVALREEIRDDASPSDPSEDELEHPEAERRREAARARRKADQQRLQEVLDDALPEVCDAVRDARLEKRGFRK